MRNIPKMCISAPCYLCGEGTAKKYCSKKHEKGHKTTKKDKPVDGLNCKECEVTISSVSLDDAKSMDNSYRFAMSPASSAPLSPYMYQPTDGYPQTGHHITALSGHSRSTSGQTIDSRHFYTSGSDNEYIKGRDAESSGAEASVAESSAAVKGKGKEKHKEKADSGSSTRSGSDKGHPQKK